MILVLLSFNYSGSIPTRTIHHSHSTGRKSGSTAWEKNVKSLGPRRYTVPCKKRKLSGWGRKQWQAGGIFSGRFGATMNNSLNKDFLETWIWSPAKPREIHRWNIFLLLSSECFLFYNTNLSCYERTLCFAAMPRWPPEPAHALCHSAGPPAPC